MIAPDDGPAPALSRANSTASGRWTQGAPSKQGSVSRQGSNASLASGADSGARTPTVLSVKLPALFKRKQKDKDILAMYDSGNLRELMADLQISEKEKGAWLKLWLDIDTSFQNRVNYQTFIDYFLFEDNAFTRKVFEIMNSDLSAVVTFREFVEFCKKYLVIDKESLQEFSFRLLLRQSARFSQHSIVDAVDLKSFIVTRYGATDSKETQKLSISLLKEMDSNEGLGLTCAQYRKFCKQCHSVESFATKFLVHIRNFVFGNDFWVKRSRLLKKLTLTGFASLTPMKRVNIDTEIYMNLLGLPVVDAKGRGIKMAGTRPRLTSGGEGILLTPSQDESVGTSITDPSRARKDSSRSLVDGRPGGLSRQSSAVSALTKQHSAASMHGGLSRGPSGISRSGSGDSDRARSLMSRADSSRSVVSNLSMTSAKEAATSRRLWVIPFDHDSQMKTNFDEDFPAILEKKMSKKLKKKKEKDELTRAAEVMSSRTYQIMVSALEDLVSSKKGLLVAFRVWKENVGMESSTPEVSITEPDDDTKHRVDTNLPVDEADSIYTRIIQSTASINSETPEEAAKAYLQSTNSSLHEKRFAYGNTDRMAGIKEYYFGGYGVDDPVHYSSRECSD